jgi:hypothetical protein
MKLYTTGETLSRRTNKHAHALTTHDPGRGYALTTQVGSHV